MGTHLEVWLIAWTRYVPLEVFTFVASFIEEVVAPIPSAGVLLATGTLAALQNRTVTDLIPLILIAAAGKTLGAAIVYYFADFFSRLVIGRLGRLIHISDAEITDLGRRITGTWRDYASLTLIRALPIIPSSIVSVGCGTLRISFTVFMTTTVLGTIVRDSVFIYAGYTGVTFFTQLLTKTVAIESFVQVVIVVVIGSIFAYVYYTRRRRQKSMRTLSTPPIT